jgi:DNA-binding GntR family transcriptional regulator
MLAVQTTADLIADALRSDILAGATPPGAPLRQEAIAQRFAVSRIPVREALRALERDGLVEVHPNRGAFVVELSAEQIREITDLRVLLEGDLIARALARMTDTDVRQIEAAAREAEAAAATPAWSQADRRFHEALYAPAGRPQQLALVLGLRRSVERYGALYGQLPERREEWLRDHAALVASCRQRDAERARRELEGHIGRAGAFLAERLKPAGEVQPSA